MSRHVLSHLCYNVPGESIYGEITPGSICQMLKHIKMPTKIDLLDIGSGSGQMLFKCLMCLRETIKFPGKLMLRGVEISSLRSELSVKILDTLLNQYKKDVNLTCKLYFGDVTKWKMLPHTLTHTISFDVTFPFETMSRIEKLQRNAPALINVISNHHTNIYSSKYWHEITKISCAICGSGTHRTFYIYEKKKKTNIK